jgi:tripartite ATP-independent transporter DctP family solute receptor
MDTKAVDHRGGQKAPLSPLPRRFTPIVAILALAGPAAAQEQIKKPEFVFKLATVAPDGTPWSQSLQDYKARVEKESNFRIKIKPYLGGTLGDENITIAECKRGSIHMWGGSTGALASTVPESALLELPYLFQSADEADYILDEVLYEDFKKLLYDRGFVLINWHENGYRSFGTKDGFVKSPADLKGKKMRSQESEVHLYTYRAIGALPQPIAVTEVLSSLQTGVVDGFDNTPLFAFAASWYQGIKNYSVSEHIYQPAAVLISREAFDKMPEDMKKVILGDARKQAAEGRAGVRAIGDALLKNFELAKIGVYRLTAEEKAVFAKSTEGVYKQWTDGPGKPAKPMLDKAIKALKEYRARKKS